MQVNRKKKKTKLYGVITIGPHARDDFHVGSVIKNELYFDKERALKVIEAYKRGYPEYITRLVETWI